MADKKKFNFIEPFKDIPKVILKFPKELVRLWKEPIKTVKEAEQRKKDILPWLYLFVSILIIGAVLSAFVEFLAFLPVVGGIGAAYCGLLLFIRKRIAASLRNRECEKCETRIPFYDSFEVEDYKYEINKSTNGASDGIVNVIVKGTERYTLKVNCTCPNCGEKKSFTVNLRGVISEIRALRVSALNADTIAKNLENDVRTEKERGFDGSTGATNRGQKSPDLVLTEYFSDIVQIG